MKIGIFGGSFDPPHTGHLIIAHLACEQLHLDKVIFVPAYRPPHKTNKHQSTSADRLRMTKLAIQGNSRFAVSDIEIRRKGISYTVDTVKQLKLRNPKAQLFLIIGSDNLRYFHSWKLPDEIMHLASLVIYKRPAARVSKRTRFQKSARLLTGPMLDISSSEIRKRIASNNSVRYLVPERVLRFIASQGLYIQ